MKPVSGLGIGLSLIAAIVKLHNFRFTIASGPGCTVEIAAPGCLESAKPARTTNMATEITRASVVDQRA
jgi:hypothetical protein